MDMPVYVNHVLHIQSKEGSVTGHKPRILLTNIGGLDNPGIRMMITAIMENVNAEFFYHKLTTCEGYEKHGLKGSWKPYCYDIALDLGGDTFTQYYGARQWMRHVLHLLLMIFTGQKFFLFTQTYSPFGYFTGIVTRWIMQRAVCITVREQESKDLLDSWAISCTLTADIAFLLDTWLSEDYDGSSYHRVIGAKLAGKKAVWNGLRANNWKFKIFTRPLSMEKMKEEAYENIRLLQGLL